MPSKIMKVNIFNIKKILKRAVDSTELKKYLVWQPSASVVLGIQYTLVAGLCSFMRSLTGKFF